MAPLGPKYPYARFEPTRVDVENPKGALLNADGFATGWFSLISRGSLSGGKSFATLHPAFLDEIYMNRLGIEREVPVVTRPDAIKVPPKAAVWPAPEGLQDSDGQPVTPRSGHRLMVARMGLTTKAMEGNKTAFMTSQVRLVCKAKVDPKQPLAGKGTVVWPLGYVSRPRKVTLKKLSEIITVERRDLEGGVRFIDFVFSVPAGYTPVLIEYKQNAIAQLPPPVSASEAPEVMPFVQISEYATETAKLKPVRSAQVYGVELRVYRTARPLIEDAMVELMKWDMAQRQNETAGEEKPVGPRLPGRRPETPATPSKPPVSKLVQVILIPSEISAATDEDEEKRETAEREKSTRAEPVVLMSPPGYSLLVLQCNKPAAGQQITADQLPVLVDQGGLNHYAAGVIAEGKSGGERLYEIIYCGLTDENEPVRLQIDDNGCVAAPFPEVVSLPSQVETMESFFVIYAVEPDEGGKRIITTVKAGQSGPAASFADAPGFLVE